MTTEQKENLKEVISRYTAWYLKDIPSEYYKSKWHWRSEIQNHIKKLEQKLKSNICTTRN